MQLSPYTAPEQLQPRLQGRVEGHLWFKDGDSITTSSIVSVDGRIVTTKSGSIYQLMEVNPVYKDWVAKNRPDIQWDDENPIRIIDNTIGDSDNAKTNMPDNFGT